MQLEHEARDFSVRTCQVQTHDALFRVANFMFDGFLGGLRPWNAPNGNVSFTAKQDVLLRERRAFPQKRQVFPFIEPRR